LIVLGLDTATSATAVAIRGAAGEILERRDDPPAGARPGHATRLLAMARALLEEAGVEWGAIERVAAGTGPGGFTGLRVGLATARGLAHALACELVGISSLKALALPALRPGALAGEEVDRVLAVIDARRHEVFAAAYAPADRESGAAGDEGSICPRELTAAVAIAPARVGELLAAAGAGERGWLGVGDGAVRYERELAGAGVALAPDSSTLHRVSAAAICELGAAAVPAGAPAGLLPDYLRRPDAEIALKGVPAQAVSGA
jgi:tRNA threonylcarbamoyladenosine biosynthesis protein TsaB